MKVIQAHAALYQEWRHPETLPKILPDHAVQNYEYRVVPDYGKVFQEKLFCKESFYLIALDR